MSVTRTGLVVLASVALAQAALGAPGKASLFRTLTSKSVFSGCGCTFIRSTAAHNSDMPVVFSSNYEGKARIATAAGVIDLSAVRPDVSCQPARVGDSCVLEYRGDTIRVTIKATATWVCPDDDTSESCEVVKLQGQLTGRAGDSEDVVDVRGTCGC